VQTITLNSQQQEIAEAFWADHGTRLNFDIKVVSSRPANLEATQLRPPEMDQRYLQL